MMTEEKDDDFDHDLVVDELRRDILETRKIARQAFKEGDFIMAISLYSDGIEMLSEGGVEAEKVPEQERKWLAKLLLRRACCFFRVGNYHKAIQDAAAALERKPEIQKAYVVKGMSLMELGRFSEASDCFIKGLEYFPGDEELKHGFDESIGGVRNYRHRYYQRNSEENFMQVGKQQQNQHQHVSEEELAKFGAFIELEDVYDKEIKFWNTLIPEERRFSKTRERYKVQQFLFTHRHELFSVFVAYLGSPFGHGDSEPLARRRSTQVLRVTPRRKSGYDSARRRGHAAGLESNQHVTNNSRTSCLITEFEEESEPPLQGAPLGTWTKMSEDQFWDFLVDTDILTEDFAEEPFHEVYEIVTRHQTKQICDNKDNDDEEKQKTKVKKGNGFNTASYLLFPKFLEGIIRLLLMRYQPFVKDTHDIHLRSEKILSLSDRVFYACNRHILASSAIHEHKSGKKLNQLPHYNVGQSNLRKMCNILSKPKKVAQILHLYDNRLRRVYDYFKDSDNEGLMLEELAKIFATSGFVDRYNHNLDTLLATTVAVTMYVGVSELQEINYDEFIQVLLWCCDTKTRDGIVPLYHRLECFLNQMFRAIQMKTDIGNLI